MKVISKYKEFYDYLQGIWGVDEKLVLDRTTFTKIAPDMFLNNSAYSIHLCGWQYDFYYNHGKFYYFDEVKALFPKQAAKRYYSVLDKEREGKGLYFPTPEKWLHSDWIYTQRVPSKANRILDHPCLIEYNRNALGNSMVINNWNHGRQGTFYPFPILKTIDFHKAIKAEEIWLLLSDWLSKKRDVLVEDKQTDKQKIVGKGFDLIKSFRHRK